VRHRYNSRRIQSVAPGTHCAIESAARINHLDSNGFADRVECAVIWSSLFVIVVFEGFRCRCYAARIMPRWTERAAKTKGLFHRLVLPGNLRSVRAIIPKHLRFPRPTQNVAGKIKPGDVFVCYLTRLSRWFGLQANDTLLAFLESL